MGGDFAYRKIDETFTNKIHQNWWNVYQTLLIDSQAYLIYCVDHDVNYKTNPLIKDIEKVIKCIETFIKRNINRYFNQNSLTKTYKHDEMLHQSCK